MLPAQLGVQMRRFARRLGTILVVIACGFLLSFVVQQVFPFRLRVGMPWDEAKRKLSWIVHYPLAISSRPALPIDEETGEIAYHPRLHAIELPGPTCIFILLHAPYDPPHKLDHGFRELHDADYSIVSFEVGPRFGGYGDKLKWSTWPKTHPQVLNLSWCSWPAVIAFVVGVVVAGVFVPRLVRRLGKRPSASS